MEKAKYSAFDLFGYALPGIFLLLSCFILFHSEIKKLTDVFTAVGQFNLNHAVLLLVVGYVVGFTFYRLGASLRRILGRKMWKDNKQFELDLSETEKLVLVREHCQENFKHIQTWFLISGMSANLALGSLVLVITGIAKLIQFNGAYLFQWAGLSVVAIFMRTFRTPNS